MSGFGGLNAFAAAARFCLDDLMVFSVFWDAFGRASVFGPSSALWFHGDTFLFCSHANLLYSLTFIL